MTIDTWQGIEIIHVDVLSPRLGETLMYAVRNARRLRLNSGLVLALSRSDFERLADYWPQFYLEGPVVETCIRDSIWSWLKRLFVRKRRVSLSPPFQLSSEMLANVKERILREQAIPVDGVWVPVSISDDEHS
jgi:hypothetical protein